jgi:type I restriction enzyme, R subunit
MARLAAEPTKYLPLRDYQEQAIHLIERRIAEGQRELLVAMATGTGKTITCIGLAYRLIKAKRFRRVLFLVDRNTLGEQAIDKLQEVRLENLQTFPDIYDVHITPSGRTRTLARRMPWSRRCIRDTPTSASRPYIHPGI